MRLHLQRRLQQGSNGLNFFVGNGCQAGAAGKDVNYPRAVENRNAPGHFEAAKNVAGKQGADDLFGAVGPAPARRYQRNEFLVAFGSAYQDVMPVIPV